MGDYSLKDNDKIYEKYSPVSICNRYLRIQPYRKFQTKFTAFVFLWFLVYGL